MVQQDKMLLNKRNSLQMQQKLQASYHKTRWDCKRGSALGISDQFQIPVRFIGVGEGIDDLQEFDPPKFYSNII